MGKMGQEKAGIALKDEQFPALNIVVRNCTHVIVMKLLGGDLVHARSKLAYAAIVVEHYIRICR